MNEIMSSLKAANDLDYLTHMQGIMFGCNDHQALSYTCIFEEC